MNKPKISVIIPLYNKERGIRRAIASVLSQTYQEFELIIVDDGSTDNSYNEATKISDNRIKIIRQENKGVSAARNRGIEESTGEWILFLDADDLLTPFCFSSLLKLYNRYNTPIVVGNTYIYDEKSNIRPFLLKVQKGKIKNNFKAVFFENLYVRMGNTLFFRCLFDDSMFNTNLSRYEDFELFFRLLRKYKVSATDDFVCIYTYDYGQLASNYENYYKDFISIIKLSNYDSFWERLNMAILLKEGYTCKKYRLLMHLSYNDKFYIFISSVLKFPTRVRKNIYKLLNSSKWK